MRRDMGHGGGNPHDVRPGAGMPPGRDSAPLHGEKPEGALFKSPEEKGSGLNVTKKGDPNSAKGVTEPGAPENRNMSAFDPHRGDLAPTALTA